MRASVLDSIIDCAAFDGVAYRFYVCYSHSSFASIFFPSCIFVLFGWMYIKFFIWKREKREKICFHRQTILSFFERNGKWKDLYWDFNSICCSVSVRFGSVRSILCCSIPMAVCIHRYHAVEIKFIVVVVLLLLRDSDKTTNEKWTDCAIHSLRALRYTSNAHSQYFPVATLTNFRFSGCCFYFRRVEVFVFVFACQLLIDFH